MKPSAWEKGGAINHGRGGALTKGQTTCTTTWKCREISPDQEPVTTQTRAWAGADILLCPHANLLGRFCHMYVLRSTSTYKLITRITSNSFVQDDEFAHDPRICRFIVQGVEAAGVVSLLTQFRELGTFVQVR